MALIRIIAAFLLVGLSVSLGAELVVSDDCVTHYSEANPALGIGVSQLSDSSTVNSGSLPAEQKAPCPDPCHGGRTHFGHCQAVVTSSFSDLTPNSDAAAQWKVVSTFLRSAALGNLKRPPRSFS